MIVGVFSWGVRYLLFSQASVSTGTPMLAMLTTAVVLHGFSYDFVFISGFLYVDKHVKEEVRAQAQGLLVVFTQGIGFFLSSQIFVGLIYPKVMGKSGDAAWQIFWLIPSGYMFVVLLLFCFLFKENGKERD